MAQKLSICKLMIPLTLSMCYFYKKAWRRIMAFLRHHGIGLLIAAIIIFFFFILTPNHLSNQSKNSFQSERQIEIKLPNPVFSSHTSIEEALKKRRSIREYKNQPLTLQEVSQLLWAAQGITRDNGFRTAPSAGALYPLEVYLVAGMIEKLSPGIYHYKPVTHSIEKIKSGDRRILLAKASLGQESVKSAESDIVITAVFSRTIKKYGDKGTCFVFMEAGHAAQNIYLQSVSLNLGTVSIGAFDTKEVKNVLDLKEEEPIYIMPIGNL